MLKVCEGKSFILKELRRWASQGERREKVPIEEV